MKTAILRKNATVIGCDFEGGVVGAQGALYCNGGWLTFINCNTYGNTLTTNSAPLINCYGTNATFINLQCNGDVGSGNYTPFIFCNSVTSAGVTFIGSGGLAKPSGGSPWFYSGDSAGPYCTTGLPIPTPGETRIIRGQATGGLSSTIMTTGSVANPYGVAVRIIRIDLEISTLSTASTATIDVGTSTTNTGDPNVVKAMTAQAVGTGTVPVFVDYTSTPLLWASANYVNLWTTATAASTNAVITYTITVMGN